MRRSAQVAKGSTPAAKVWGDQHLETSSSVAWVKPSPEAVVEHEKLYEIAYAEATKALEDQVDELGSARTRAVQFLALASAATAFLAGAAINSMGQRTAPFYVLSVAGTILALAAIICVARLLNPWATPLFSRMNPKSVIVGYIERDVPVPNKAELLRQLALHLGEWQDANAQALARVRQLYFASVVLGGLQVVAWAALTWVAR